METVRPVSLTLYSGLSRLGYVGACSDSAKDLQSFAKGSIPCFPEVLYSVYGSEFTVYDLGIKFRGKAHIL